MKKTFDKNKILNFIVDVEFWLKNNKDYKKHISITKGETIIDMPKFIHTHINFIKDNIDNSQKIKVYLIRLYRVYKKISNE